MLTKEYKAALAALTAAEADMNALKYALKELGADAALMGASMLPPPLGTAADIASLGVSLGRGDWGGALWDVVGLIPIVGDGAKAAAKGTKAAKKFKAIEKAIAKGEKVIAKKKDDLAKLCKKNRVGKDKVRKAAKESGCEVCGAGGKSGTIGGKNGATNRASHETHKTQLRQQMSMPSVENPQLQKITNSLYRPNAKIGSGSAVGGRLHTQKGEDSIRALDKWLNKNPKASPGDQAAAENIILDLQNALGH